MEKNITLPQNIIDVIDMFGLTENTKAALNCIIAKSKDKSVKKDNDGYFYLSNEEIARSCQFSFQTAHKVTKALGNWGIVARKDGDYTRCQRPKYKVDIRKMKRYKPKSYNTLMREIENLTQMVDNLQYDNERYKYQIDRHDSDYSHMQQSLEEEVDKWKKRYDNIIGLDPNKKKDRKQIEIINHLQNLIHKKDATINQLKTAANR